jgi:hypothetical protein
MALEFLKGIFGDDGKKALTQAEFEAAVEAAKLDIVDISTGNYVSKQKYDRVEGQRAKFENDAKEAKKQLEEAQKSGVTDEATKKRIESLEKDLATANANLAAANTKLTKRDQYDAALKAVKGNIKLAKLLQMEASELVTEDVDFETAMAKVMKGDKETYTITDTDDGGKGDDGKTTTVKTEGNNNQSTKKPTGDKEDAAVLKAFGLPEDTEIPTK